MSSLRSAVSHLKGRARRVTWLYELIRKRRARSKESEYLSLREHYYQQTKSLFAEPGYMRKSRELLHKNWRGAPQAKSLPQDVRLFAVGANVVGSALILPELERSFDAVVFDFADDCRKVEREHDQTARERIQQKLLAAFHRAHRERPIDLAWLSATNTFVSPQTLHAIRRAGVPVAVYNMDDKHQYSEDTRLGFPNGQKPLIGAADVHLTNSIDCVRWYMAEGVAAYYMPPGVDTEFFCPPRVDKDLDVSFIGAAYGMRRRFIQTLQQAGIRITCFGKDWGTRFVSDVEKVGIFGRSKINLGIGGVGYSERITCLKGRDAEVPGSGNLYLTIYDGELSRMWTIGKEILCYFNEIDCVEQIRYYLDRPDKVAAMGQAARARALQEHTWTRRVVGLLQWMGVLAAETGTVPENSSRVMADQL